MKRGQIKKTVISHRRLRKNKYKKLKSRYASSGSLTEKNQLIQKVMKIAPWFNEKEATNLLKKK